ncbi:MAG: hypothetical protein FJW79_12645, partial [Actinobacteria bacterium]|nr:hypothetical protein [Actinomycetota bacterium]
MPLQVGDTTRFDGYNGTVVATTATLNADGRGSITYDGDTFQFRVLKCASDGGTDYGLSTGG